MKDDRKSRAQPMLEALSEYCHARGGKAVIYMLRDEDPLPAPQLRDYTLHDGKAMVIVPAHFVDNEDEDMLQ